MPSLLDANAILRFLLNDIPQQAEQTAQAIYTGAFTIEAVLAEVVYVLDGVYERPRDEIAGTLIELLNLIAIENPEVVMQSLDLYGRTSLDFVDCLLISYNHVQKIPIVSFDKKLNSRLLPPESSS